MKCIDPSLVFFVVDPPGFFPEFRFCFLNVLLNWPSKMNSWVVTLNFKWAICGVTKCKITQQVLSCLFFRALYQFCVVVPLIVHGNNGWEFKKRNNLSSLLKQRILFFFYLSTRPWRYFFQVVRQGALLWIERDRKKEQCVLRSCEVTRTTSAANFALKK